MIVQISDGAAEFKHNGQWLHVRYDVMPETTIVCIYDANWQLLTRVEKKASLETIIEEWKGQHERTMASR